MEELKCAYEFANFRQIENFRIVIYETARTLGTHERTHNALKLNEVDILLPNNPVGHHDIVLHMHTRSDQLQRISEFHTAYDSLQYPIHFPGSDSWNLIMKITGQHKVTQLQLYCFHLFTRQGNHLLQTRRLLQQFMVGAYAKIECERF